MLIFYVFSTDVAVFHLKKRWKHATLNCNIHLAPPHIMHLQ